MSVHVCRGLKGGKRGSYVLVLGVIDTCSTTDLVERRLMRTNHCRPMAALLMAGVCTLAGRDSSGSVKTGPHTFRAALAVAEAVLYGEIIDKAVFQSPDGPQIWTRYTLAVERMLAGEVASSRFEFWVYGGKVGNVGTFASETAHYDVGERVVLAYDADNWLGGTGLGTAGVLREVRLASGAMALINEEGMAISGAGDTGLEFAVKVRQRVEGVSQMVDVSALMGGSPWAATQALDEVAREAGAQVQQPRRLTSETLDVPVLGRQHAHQ